MESTKIFDENGKELNLAEVIGDFLRKENTINSESSVMIGLRGFHNESTCLIHVRPVDYEPHSITIIKDL